MLIYSLLVCASVAVIALLYLFLLVVLAWTNLDRKLKFVAKPAAADCIITTVFTHRHMPCGVLRENYNCYRSIKQYLNDIPYAQ